MGLRVWGLGRVHGLGSGGFWVLRYMGSDEPVLCSWVMLANVYSLSPEPVNDCSGAFDAASCTTAGIQLQSKKRTHKRSAIPSPWP